MAVEEKQSRLSFWYHVAASLLIIAVMFSLATYVFLRTQEGIVAWQVYPAFTVFIIAIFIGDWLINRREYGPE